MKDLRNLQFNEALLEATDQAMTADGRVILMGLGVTDPLGIFGTTKGLVDKFGCDRVFETPTAENGTMGIAIGSALVGARPIVTHQRVEFSLLAIEQLTNQAAKWNYMTNGKKCVPLVTRLIVGRGWGQGPQHSQSLDSWFAHIPGLKVVAPASPHDAKGLLMAAINDDNPVVFMEHRWLHRTFGHVPIEPYEVPIGSAKVVRQGTDVTIVTYSYMVTEALRTAKILEAFGVNVEIVDLRTYRPLDTQTILASVQKTGRLITIDNGWVKYGVGAEIVSTVVSNNFSCLKSAPIRLGIKDVPIPSSRSLANEVYPGPKQIAAAIQSALGVTIDIAATALPDVQDTPDDEFKGPF